MTRAELQEKTGQWSALTWFIFFTFLPFWMVLALVDLTLENFAEHYDDFEGRH